MITPLEQRVYNCWLATTRSKCGKPFKLRKQWDGFEEKNDYMSIKKLANIFTRYDNIIINEWFEAPFLIYPETQTQYDLKFYTTTKAFSCYKLSKTKFKQMTQEQFNKSLYKNKLTKQK